jgi:predicted PurR-regulated permease PerM
MTNYIIAPQVFYWINTLSIMRTVLEIFGGVCIAAFIGLLCGWIYNACEAQICEYNQFYMKVCKKWAIITGILGLIMIVLGIFIPSKATSIEMLVAKTATFNNVDWTIQQVKEVVDYIVQAIKTI